MEGKSKNKIPKNRIALLREEHGWSQADLAERVYLSPRHISRIETGNSAPTETLMQLADFFGVSLDYLLGRTDTREINKCDEIERQILEQLRQLSDIERAKVLKHLVLENSLKSEMP